MEAAEKPLVWLKGEVKTPPFSAEARLEAGVLLRRIQRGEKLSLPASRPMPTIGAGCHELRIGDKNATWRIVYFIADEFVVVLDVFDKNTPATPSGVVENCKCRLRSFKAASETS